MKTASMPSLLCLRLAAWMLAANCVFANPDGMTVRSGTAASHASGPVLTVNPLGTNVVVTWPLYASAYQLLYATNLTPPVS